MTKHSKIVVHLKNFTIVVILDQRHKYYEKSLNLCNIFESILSKEPGAPKATNEPTLLVSALYNMQLLL